MKNTPKNKEQDISDKEAIKKTGSFSKYRTIMDNFRVRNLIFTLLLLSSCVDDKASTKVDGSNDLKTELNDQYIGYHYGYDLEDRFGDKIKIRGKAVHVPLSKYQLLIEKDSIVFLKQTNVKENAIYNYQGNLVKKVNSDSKNIVYTCNLISTDGSSSPTLTITYNLENNSIFCKDASSPYQFSLFRKQNYKEYDNLSFDGFNYTYFVQNFIKLLENDKKESLSKLFIGYSEYIKNRTDFLEQYDSILTPTIVSKITNSDLEKDWSTVGWRGILGPDVYMDYSGTILRLPESKREKQFQVDQKIAEKNTLHSSINEFNNNVFSIKTRKFIVRIDELNDGSLRYASWSINQILAEKPSLVLFNGKRIFEGSGGNNYIQFTNKNIVYIVRENRLTDDETPPFVLEVYQNDKLIVDQPAAALK
jgi:hypothetical protein